MKVQASFLRGREVKEVELFGETIMSWGAEISLGRLPDGTFEIFQRLDGESEWAQAEGWADLLEDGGDEMELLKLNGFAACTLPNGNVIIKRT